MVLSFAILPGGRHLFLPASDATDSMKNCFPSLRLAQPSSVMPDIPATAQTSSRPTPFPENAVFPPRHQEACSHDAGMPKRPANRSAASRLIRGTVALGGMFASPAPARAQGLPQQTESPCEALNGLRIGLTAELEPTSIPFDVRIHGGKYDRHCAVIKEVDRKHATAGYLLIPGEFFAAKKEALQGFYNPFADQTILDARPVGTAAEIENLKGTVRHEARHRYIGQRNVRENLADFQTSTYGAFDPCLFRRNVEQCQQNLLNVPDLLKMLDVGPPESFAPALQEKIVLKLQEAMHLLASDHLIVMLHREHLAQAPGLFHGQMNSGPVHQDGQTCMSLRLPDDPSERFQDFITHMFNSARPAIRGYTDMAGSFSKEERVHMLAAEYDATLVGLYGIKSAQAIITAASYLPVARQNPEL